MNWIKARWKKTEANPKTVRQFGWILTGILFVLGLLSFLRGHTQYQVEWPLSFLAAALTLWMLPALTIFYRAWMLVAGGISWVLLRVILAILFYLVLTPLGFILRLSGKDLLDEKIDRAAGSYWNKRVSQPTSEQYEKLY